MVEEAYEKAKSLLKDNREKLDALAQILVEREVIFREDVEAIYGPRPWDAETEIKKDETETKKEETEIKKDEIEIKKENDE